MPETRESGPAMTPTERARLQREAEAAGPSDFNWTRDEILALLAEIARLERDAMCVQWALDYFKGAVPAIPDPRSKMCQHLEHESCAGESSNWRCNCRCHSAEREEPSR